MISEVHDALKDAGASEDKARKALGVQPRYFAVISRTDNLKTLSEEARTIADLAGEERVGGAHLAEAIQYRALNSK